MTALIGNRYLLQEELGTGGMGVVYRAHDRLATDSSMDVVALKRVLPLSERGDSTVGHSESFDTRLSLAQEFKLLATLRHPNIISVLDYGFDMVEGQRQPFFTMELLRNPKPITEAGKDQPLETQVNLLVQLLQALVYLHRRGIIHRDLKPSNVLVTDGRLKTLDFGLSMGREQDSTDDTGSTTAGTIGYMAPEVLMGHPSSESSDLYAVGVIAYELFTGQHPFHSDDPGLLINKIFEVVPQVDSIPLGLSVVVSRLMSKSADARYESARDVIAAMGRAIGKEIAVETAATRESFLQAARLVGRDAELAQLVNALETTQKENAGALWLVAGESGVGKSRLIDELRTMALVRGIPVLRGQGVAEQSALYSIWRPALRALVLSAELDDTEASILKPLIPDIADLLERPIPDAPTTNPAAAQERLFKTIEALFRKQPQSLLIILEDLHWADESLELMRHLSAAALPMLWVGSYRDDERPDLPTRLPDAKLLKLSRLSQEGIAQLSEAILGENGRQPHVVDLLKRETEGNVFFLVEVVRALAEDAGQLEEIGLMTLPQHIFAGGVQRIVTRRLERVPAWGRVMLRIAAVAGRQLDIELLQALVQAAALPADKSLEDWLTICGDAAVLEVQENQWRFSHDKLREGILEELDDAQKQGIHQQIAQTMEQVYAGVVDRAAVLMEHWHNAGNTAKEAQYAILAGDQAMQQGANRQAMEFFETATAALEKLPDAPETQRQYIDTVVKLSRVGAFHMRGSGASLKAQLERALQLAKSLHDEVREAYALGSIGAHLYVRGELGPAIGYFMQVISLAEKLGLEELLMVPYNIMARVFVLSGDLPKALPMLLKGIPLAEKYHDLEMLSGSLAYHALICVFQGNLEESKQIFEHATAVGQELGHPSRLSGNLTILGCAYSIAGLPDESDDMLKRSQVIAEQTHDQQIIYMNTGSMGYNQALYGHYETARDYLDRALQTAEKNRWGLYVGLFSVYRAEVELLLGNLEQAMTRAQVALAISQAGSQKTAVGEAQRVMAKVYMQQQQWAEAESALLSAVRLLEEITMPSPAAICKYELAQVYRALKQPEKARAMLDAALATFEHFKMQRYVEKARILQAQS
ncbi:MAG: protein kinase [Anaerolineae bacterium]